LPTRALLTQAREDHRYGPIQATHDTKDHPVATPFGGLALAGGIVLVIIGAKISPDNSRLKRKGDDTDVIIDSFVLGDRNHWGIFGFG